MARAAASYVAAHRFGLGAKPGEIAAIGGDARGWLANQLAQPNAFTVAGAALPTRAEAAAAFQGFQQRRRDLQAEAQARVAAGEAAPEGQGKRREIAEIPQREGAARLTQAIATEHAFAERLALFWANHFTMAATKVTTIPYVGLFEREAVRANMGGSFAALLLATARHPGMLLYLDQAQSAGPNSELGRRRELGLNENLAREILELHTLGAQGGYTQADVTEFARALTGWTLAAPRLQRFAPNARPGEFLFAAVLHEPGARTVLGKRYPEGGEDQARAILLDLARHPATGRRIAHKLARHFIADEPPASAVASLEGVFRRTEGDLPSLHRAVLELDAAWAPEPHKFKSPYEFIISAMRLLGLEGGDMRAAALGLELLGQPLFRAPSPEGWPDDAASWASADGLMKRLEWAEALSRRVGVRARPEDLAAEALGPLLQDGTRQSIKRAESAAQGLALLLLSPEFQRR